MNSLPQPSSCLKTDKYLKISKLPGTYNIERLPCFFTVRRFEFQREIKLTVTKLHVLDNYTQETPVQPPLLAKVVYKVVFISSISIQVDSLPLFYCHTLLDFSAEIQGFLSHFALPYSNSIAA